ncbi:hypothetical protein QYM36_015602 [Artemia franciscana]|uniref:Uncharacterized protein n=1 Tax=Artemia franciscana TaxID=6661 RepID=A0AA88HCS3_ARTSF|nr:hypothetical protein QYM36_015602 [Artemia franciscana]
MSVVESYVNPFDCTEKELVNIMTSEVAENSIRDSLLAAEENGLRAIEAFFAGQPSPFSKIKVLTMASSLKDGKDQKKKVFNCVQEELEVTRKILLACGSVSDTSLSVLRRLMPHGLLPVSPALFERTGTSAGIWLRTGSTAALIDSIRMLSAIDSWPMNVTLRREAKQAVLLDFMALIRTQNRKHGLSAVLAGGFTDRSEVYVKGLPFDVFSELTESLASTHEETDTRLVLHVAHCFRRGYQQVIVKANDTEISAMLIQHFKIMTSKCTASDPELYLKFRDKTFPIHIVVKKIPVSVTNTITFLRCFIGYNGGTIFQEALYERLLHLLDNFDLKKLNKILKKESPYDKRVELSRMRERVHEMISKCLTALAINNNFMEQSKYVADILALDWNHPKKITDLNKLWFDLNENPPTGLNDRASKARDYCRNLANTCG